jgi:multidrug transporter EmrE-like cation transporter
LQTIMILTISYSLLALPLTKKSLDQLAHALKYTLWKKESNIGISWVSWLYIHIPKHLRGASFFD